MSVVSNVILTFWLGEDGATEDYPALIPIQSFLGYRGSLRSMSDAAGGNKALEMEVWVGAFNFLDTDEFVNVVASAPWQYPDYVQLFISEDGAHEFREYKMDFHRS